MATRPTNLNTVSPGRTRNGPPALGIPLSWRLGITTVLIVVVVIGIASGLKQQWEVERGYEDRREFLRDLLAPLAA